MMGGGSAPEHPLPTALIEISSESESATTLEKRLRESKPPVIARIERDRLIIDLRSVLPRDEEQLATAIALLGVRNC